MNNSILERIATFVSTVMSPLMMPTYGIFLALWVSIMSLAPVGSRLFVLSVVFFLTFVLPVIFVSVLVRLKKVKHFNLDDQHDRKLPYIFAIVCYAVTALYLNSVHAPIWLIAFVIGGVLAAAIAFIVNFWWKISGHMTGISGIIALLFFIHTYGLEAFDLFWLIIATILLAGVVGTARLVLRQHTIAQEVVGFANGFFSVALAMQIIVDIFM